MSKIMPFAGTMLKNLFSKPVTTAYPSKPDVYPEKVAGIFGQIGTAPADAVGRLKALRDEVVFLCSQA